MKRNNLKWALPMAALCLLATACSKENSNEPTAPKTRELTINCGIGATAATPGTRAGVKPGNTDESKEYFIWHKDDAFNAYLIPGEGTNYDATPQSFAIKDYSAPSNSASFTCSHFPNNDNSYKMLAVYPKDNFTRADGVFTATIPYEQTQIGKDNTDHLAASMCMYAITEVPKNEKVPNLTFHHLTSLFRFTVTNKNASPCRINQIRVSGNNLEYFGTGVSLKVNWEDKTITPTTTYEDTSYIILLNLKASLNDNNGIELPAEKADGKSNFFDAYTTVMQSDDFLLDKNSLLKFNINVTDADGKNPREYASLKLNGANIIDANPGDVVANPDDVVADPDYGDAITWKPGKRYWFDLVLDDVLTVTLKEVTPMTGWDSETDL